MGCNVSNEIKEEKKIEKFKEMLREKIKEEKIGKKELDKAINYIKAMDNIKN